MRRLRAAQRWASQERTPAARDLCPDPLPLSVAPGTTAPAEASTGAADPQCPWSGTFFVNKVLLKQTTSAHLHVACSHLSPDETLPQRPRGSRSLKCSRPGVFPEQAYQPPIWETVGNAETEALPQAS